MKQMITQTLSTLSDLPDIFECYCRQIPMERLDQKRNDTAWTIREHIYHVVGVQKMLFERIKTLAYNEKPEIEPYFPENEHDRDAKYPDLAAAFREYHHYRKLQVSLVRHLKKQALEKEGVHKEYILYTIPVLLQHIISHDYWHLYRIEEIWLIRDAYFS